MPALTAKSFRLEYNDKEQESRFSEFFGLKYRSTALLLTLLLTCIWAIRGYHYYFLTDKMAGACLTALAVVSAVLQIHHAWYIIRDPSSWCSESSRGYLFVADLTACTAAVVFTANYAPAPFTSSIYVHSIHGWCTPFAGFRLSADCLLHALNLQCFLIMSFSETLQGSGVSAARLCSNSVKLVLLNAILPMAINLRYEAKHRIQFSKQNGHEQVQPLWLRALSFGESLRLYPS